MTLTESFREKIRHVFLRGLLSFVLISSFGCAGAGGPLFQKFQIKHNGNAVIYIYRDDEYGYAETPTLKINGEEVIRLKNKGYYILVFDPDEYSFEQKWLVGTPKEAKKFLFEKNNTYFIRSWLKPIGRNFSLFGTGSPILEEGLFLFKKEEALKTLKNCRLIKPLPESYKQYMVETETK